MNDPYDEHSEHQAEVSQNLDAERMTGNTDIDWLRSTTTATTEHTKGAPATPARVEHVAYFGIKPKSVPTVQLEYGRVRFWPLFMAVTGVNGTLRRVHMSGKQATKAGLGQADRDRTFGQWSRNPANRDRMPKLVRDSIESYETKVPVGSTSPMVVE